MITNVLSVRLRQKTFMRRSGHTVRCPNFGNSISEWRNEAQKDGQTVVRHSVRIQKQFRKDEGDYQETNIYFRDDIPRLILVAQKAYEYIALTESKDAEESVPV